MFSKHLFSAARLVTNRYALAIVPRHISTSSALMRNAPIVPEFTEVKEEGHVYDPKNESLESFLNLNFGPNMPTINDDKNPQRDLVNFPRPVQRDFPEPVRMGIVPESWCNFFYPKTGVTGPYMFFGTFLTFLMSKEWLVIEHEILVGIHATIIILVGVKMFGKPQRNQICAEIDAEQKKWDDWQKGMINFLNEYINKELQIRDSPKHVSVLFDAKRENIKLQLEAEYRRRQMLAYSEVQKRLNYLVAKEEALKQFKQKQMVSWIIDNVEKSITPAHEKEALKTTLSELKKLAGKLAV